MNLIRSDVRERLSPQERKLEEWLSEVQSETPEASGGLFARCTVIASLKPALSWWEIVAWCKQTVEARIQLQDLPRYFRDAGPLRPV